MTIKHMYCDTVDFRNNRFINNEGLLKLDLVFTKEPENVNEIKYITPIGKSDHILLELELKENATTIRNKG